jgi:hypothetical protein
MTAPFIPAHIIEQARQLVFVDQRVIGTLANDGNTERANRELDTHTANMEALAAQAGVRVIDLVNAVVASVKR